MCDHPFPIHKIGGYAAKLLLPGSEGSVLASFSKAIYLSHTSDEVIWFVSGDAPMHRRAIQLHGSIPGFPVDTVYFIKDKILSLESGYSLDLSCAERWESASLYNNNILSLKDLRERLSSFLSHYDVFPSPTGLGIFIKNILGTHHDQLLSQLSNDMELTSTQRYAQPTIKHIVSACLAHDIDGILEFGQELIGLGEGLTPSGDDFMGGLLFCIRILQDVYQPFQSSILSHLDDFSEHSKSRTNLISYTMLKDHAHGHASETLHAFIHALVTDQDQKTIVHLGSKLIQIGHSTGWDLLTGVIAGLLLIYV